MTLDQRQENQRALRLLDGSTAQQSSESLPEEERHESKVSCELSGKPNGSNPRECSSYCYHRRQQTAAPAPKQRSLIILCLIPLRLSPPAHLAKVPSPRNNLLGAEGAGEYSSLISELAEKFGCDVTLQYGRSDMHCSPRKREPLSWFCGGLVSPHLRASQRHFQEAVKMAIEMVNARGDLADRLDKVATASSAS